MALKKCTECGKEMSAGARTCPHCGKSYTTVGGIFIAVLIALVIGGCVFSQR
jgi:RNA polymerase subunit RPABC4/transcription elongation factor Spt4